jgi:hypothetical protein
MPSLLPKLLLASLRLDARGRAISAVSQIAPGSNALSAACSYRGAGDIHRPSTQSDVEHVSAEQINRSD